MPSLTIRNLQPETKDELRRRATAHGRSMQDEARVILLDALTPTAPAADLSPETGREIYDYIRSLVEPIGGVDDLVLLPRELARDPPKFD